MDMCETAGFQENVQNTVKLPEIKYVSLCYLYHFLLSEGGAVKPSRNVLISGQWRCA